jgi:ribosome-associated toxin RatA of RatAB toxin-antitoxin module
MVLIKQSVEVTGSVDRIWDLVSDVDNDAKYWSGMNSISNVRKNGNVIERDAKVGFMGHEGHQVIKLNPKQSVDLNMTKGPLKGSRTIKLVPLGNNKTRLEVMWDFQFSGVPIFARAFVKTQLEHITKEALGKLASVAERASFAGTQNLGPSAN